MHHLVNKIDYPVINGAIYFKALFEYLTFKNRQERTVILNIFSIPCYREIRKI